MYDPRRILKSETWDRAFFTTYSLSLSFFEAVILEELARKRVPKTTILADIDGVRSTFQEVGATSVGRSYMLEPIRVRHGCFHPKVSIFANTNDLHILVGSGNLTFGGWGSNFECIEHLHGSFAGEALRDVAGFFDILSDYGAASHNTGDECREIAALCRHHAISSTSSLSLRYIHNLSQPIAEQIIALSDRLGAPQKLTIVSPFFDSGAGISALCNGLGIEKVKIHAHSAGPVRSAGAQNWPTECSKPVEAVAISHMADDRQLHAKLFEVIFERGRAVISGSANATSAALGSGRNIEACVVRIYRSSTPSWHLLPALPIATPKGEPPSETTEAKDGVLRISLRGRQIDGQVLSSFAAGPATLSHLSLSSPTAIAFVTVSDDGRFTCAAPEFEQKAWQSNRVILQLETTGHVAKGYLLLPDYQNVLRHSGRIAAHIMRVLVRSETSEDIAAIMSWVAEAIKYRQFAPQSQRATGAAPPQPLILVADLLHASFISGQAGQESSKRGEFDRISELLLRAFQQQRPLVKTTSVSTPPSNEDPDDDGGTPSPETPEVRRITESFSDLFEKIIQKADDQARLQLLFHLTQFVCSATGRPCAVVLEFLSRIIRAALSTPKCKENVEILAPAIMLFYAAQADKPIDIRARATRRYLLRLHGTLPEEPPSFEPVEAFRSLIYISLDLEEFWGLIKGAHTIQEEILAFKAADPTKLPLSAFPLLSSYEFWPDLCAEKRDLAKPRRRRRFHILDTFDTACPVHHWQFSFSFQQELKATGLINGHTDCGCTILCGEF